MNSIKIAPSLLSADFGKLNDEIKSIERAGADLLHIDVMDGHFVPNITIGPAVLESIRKRTRLVFDTHLMIENPLRFIDAFVRAGSNAITVHAEVVTPLLLRRLGKYLRAKNVRLGISLNPRTSFERIKQALGFVDMVLVMSVNPGFGGQAFMPEAVPKIRKIRAIFDKDIAVDGGITEKTASSVVKAGANILVAGSYVFKSKDRKGAIEKLRNAARRASLS